MQHFPIRLAVAATSTAIAVFGAAPAFAADAAPLPPTSVTATDVAADAEVDVAWTDASTDETSFVIERCQGVGCTTFTVLTTWPAIAGTGSHPWYADCTGLLPGNTYQYRIGAVNAAGTSYSDVVSVTIPSSRPPAAPTSVTATDVAADAEVDVAWVDASTDETSFVIERCDKKKCTSFTLLTTWPAIGGTGGHPWYADCIGLKTGHTYYYRVGAVNAFGVNYSPTVAVTITR
jgi:predicted phage tail protein